MSGSGSAVAPTGPVPSGAEGATATSPLEAFAGAPDLPQTTPLYRLALATVAFLMVLLPLTYVGVVGLVACAIYWHAAHDNWVIDGWIGGFLYVSPIVAGVMLVFFMLKPFLAACPPDPPRFTIRDDDEPLLVAFVTRVCATVRAPAPVRIGHRVERDGR